MKNKKLSFCIILVHPLFSDLILYALQTCSCFINDLVILNKSQITTPQCMVQKEFLCFQPRTLLLLLNYYFNNKVAWHIFFLTCAEIKWIFIDEKNSNFISGNQFLYHNPICQNTDFLHSHSTSPL